MKKELLKQTATALLIAITALAGCKKDTDPVIAVSEMTMTTAIDGGVTIYMAGTGTAVIDWGDGSAPQTVTLSAYDGDWNLDSQQYKHTFSGTTSRTIVIEGQNITHLVCAFLQLTALDVTKNTALVWLNCYMNKLTALDITKNTALERFECARNWLTNFNVTNNTALVWFDCHGNELTSLDVTQNTVLTFFRCGENLLTAEGLNALFGTLHANAGNKNIYISGNPGLLSCDRTIATAKGWEIDY